MRPSIYFYDAQNPSLCVPLETALYMGKKQNACYIPKQIPPLPDSLIYKNPPPSFRDVAFEVSRVFFQDMIQETDLYALITAAFPFRVPVFPIDPRTYILELTHGESGSCTDFGARFTAQLIAYFRRADHTPLHLLFTGNEFEILSLAKAFSEHENINCTFLYPKDSFQNKAAQQLLSLQKNIHAFAVDGLSSDCTAMIQGIVEDAEVCRQAELFIPSTTHIGYLLAYTCCCIYAALTVLSRCSYDNRIETPHLIIGASLTQPNAISAAMLAKRMNAPVTGGITAADPTCRIVKTRYTEEWAQLKLLCENNAPESEVMPYRLRQNDILNAMRTCNDRTGCIISPDAAAIWHVWNAIRNGIPKSNSAGHHFLQDFCIDRTALPHWISDNRIAGSGLSIILETAHPALHPNTVKAAIGREPVIPHRFEVKPQAVQPHIIMQPSEAALKDWLLSIT